MKIQVLFSSNWQKNLTFDSKAIIIVPDMVESQELLSAILEKEIRQLDKKIKLLQERRSQVELLLKQQSSLRKEETLVQKVVGALSNADRPLQSKDLLKAIFTDSGNKHLINEQRKLSATLSQEIARNEPRVKREPLGMGIMFYTLPEWYQEGTLKQDYKKKLPTVTAVSSQA